MASSLKLPSASELSGVWQLRDGEQECEVVLHSTPLVDNTWRLDGDAQCLKALLSDVPAGWRPTPDGITLTREQGDSVAFFSKEIKGYTLILPDGSTRTLHKQP
ncbi:proteinase inhibitor [Pectobacterium betavasculorum]|uniref:Proteinase inhibitor n=1 Tax=Pectobacterium betavasculorum TaxID=55207 RepID=A0A093RVZ4_9GAMM|nr:protease inhibitor Inh/omp19 family protein [Pectobacterium betavasculorum]KFX06975.1 proteinase inhibitor [Pectobacterium betavasculorum]KFX21257.1 proteinase inhibitor [Pectobacterium betavasculorum]